MYTNEYLRIPVWIWFVLKCNVDGIKLIDHDTGGVHIDCMLDHYARLRIEDHLGVQ